MVVVAALMIPLVIVLMYVVQANLTNSTEGSLTLKASDIMIVRGTDDGFEVLRQQLLNRAAAPELAKACNERDAADPLGSRERCKEGRFGSITDRHERLCRGPAELLVAEEPGQKMN